MQLSVNFPKIASLTIYQQDHQMHRLYKLNLAHWPIYAKDTYLSDRQRALKNGTDDGFIYMTSNYFMCEYDDI